MATRAAISHRDAEVQKRLEAAVASLADRAGVALPDHPPFVRDAAYRAVDGREWLTTTLERIVEASTPEKGTSA